MITAKDLLGRWRFRGTRVVTCPDNREPAALEVTGPDLNHLEVTHCSRWPEKGECEQHCVLQVWAAPDGCLFPKVFEAWFREQNCAFCGKSLKDTSWLEHRPALVGPDGTTIEWKSVGPDMIVKLMETHQACCWNCHVAETFRRKRPDLVTERDFKR